jgi:hypothetical protein
LNESPEALYQIKEVYPQAGRDLGIYRYEDEFLYDMPADSAVIVSVEHNPVHRSVETATQCGRSQHNARIGMLFFTNAQ